MTYQFVTLEMIEKCKINGGFIDQNDFKTSANYVFDILVITENVMLLLDLYIKYEQSIIAKIHYQKKIISRRCYARQTIYTLIPLIFAPL